MTWERVMLGDICRPKQWKTLSKNEMSSEGFPVYGANGRIGFSETYTHEKPVILVGCRGSCGTVHVTEPRSYANGNAMALDALDERRVDLWFLERYLRHRGFRDTISGTSQPQIIRANIVKVDVRLPPLAEQKRIAGILDAADALRAKRREALAQLNTLLQSTFLDMFGDPVTNPMGWETRTLDAVGQVKTGSTPPSKLDRMFDGGIPFVTPGDLCDTWVESARTVTEAGAERSRTVAKGATLVCCIGATIGKMGKAAEFSAFNQQINAVTWGEQVEDNFGLELMRYNAANRLFMIR